MPIMDELLTARSRQCIPYMDPQMSPEEAKEYILSFVNDQRISPQMMFNLFQTTLKLFNAGGGLCDLSRWNLPTHEQDNLPKVVFDDVDIVSLKSLVCNCSCLYVVDSCSHTT